MRLRPAPKIRYPFITKPHEYKETKIRKNQEKVIRKILQILHVLHVGFDPVFIDVITKLYDKTGKMAKELPTIGDHHPWSRIELIPGGNGFNFARALHRKSLDVVFWGKIDDVYHSLVEIREPSMKLGVLGKDGGDKFRSNITVALETLDGEVQINSVQFGVSAEDLNENALKALKQTRVLSFLNIGLNNHWDSLFFKMCEIISNENNTEISLFDPSTLKGFEKWGRLKDWLEKSFSLLPGEKILSVNEFEAEVLTSKFSLEFLKKVSTYVVVHTAITVTIYSGGGKEIVEVPSLEGEPITHVGVGDTFNAGLIASFLKERDVTIAVKKGIRFAQELMSFGWEGLGKSQL